MQLVSWRANNDGLDVALAVNRLVSAGAEAWWLTAADAPAEAGDYLVDGPGAVQGLRRLGIASTSFDGKVPGTAVRLTRPAVALFTGEATGYPYYGYYALCLLRLGLPYIPVDGAAIAAGALDAANLFVIPGGFATWGLDNAEDAPGADARVRRFLEQGGSAIGSCGGAFYLSAGRPGWTGTARAKPHFTHEYLQSGVGVVDLTLRPGRLSIGLPPTIDMPYYHGPLYGELGEGIDVAATFRALVVPGRVGIDNPLDEAKFAQTMAGKPAILRAEGPRGRAVLFSPHPEMGDLLRKYIALDGYARKYLPIRGFGTLRDTMRHYRTSDSPSFRLVLNAAHDLGEHARQPGATWGSRAPEAPDAVSVAAALRARLDRLPAADDVLQPLVDDVASHLVVHLQRAAPLVDRQTRALAAMGADAPILHGAWAHLARAIHARACEEAEKPLAQELMEIELGACLMEAWAGLANFETALAEVQ